MFITETMITVKVTEVVTEVVASAEEDAIDTTGEIYQLCLFAENYRYTSLLMSLSTGLLVYRRRIELSTGKLIAGTVYDLPVVGTYDDCWARKYLAE